MIDFSLPKSSILLYYHYFSWPFDSESLSEGPTFVVVLTACVVQLSVAVDDRFQSEQYLWIRSLSFLALGILGLVPTFHSTFIFEVRIIRQSVG